MMLVVDDQPLTDDERAVWCAAFGTCIVHFGSATEREREYASRQADAAVRALWRLLGAASQDATGDTMPVEAEREEATSG